MSEPIWVPRLVVDAAHLDQLREHGGLSGVRDENALESALARARQKWSYELESDIASLAAAYGFGVAKAHAFSDGNKRTAFITMMTCLGLNGHELTATEAEVVETMVAVAEGSMTEPALAKWVNARLTALEL